MLARLGSVIYWGCTLIAVAAVAANLIFDGEDSGAIIALGFILWLIGRAAKYVLAGE